MQNRTISYLIVFALFALFFTSCDKQHLVEPSPKPTDEQRLIKWGIHTGKKLTLEKIPDTKAIVDHDDDFVKQCTPSNLEYEAGVYGGGQSIGFWVDYLEYNNNIISRSKDIFGHNETQLLYFPKDGGERDWNYQGADKFWAIGGKYKVRAFYPFSLSPYIIKESSNADLIAIEYNTHTIQQDLMIAYNEVHTVDPVTNSPSIAIADIIAEGGAMEQEHELSTSEETGTAPWRGFSQEFNLDDPIPLMFEHMLAAVSVRFSFSYSDRDTLLACSFSNKSKVNGFHTVGVLVHGDHDGLGTLESNKTYKWITYQSTFDGIPVYTWEVDGDQWGIPFSRIEGVEERMAIPYSKQGKVLVHDSYGQADTLTNCFYEEIPLKKKTPPYYNENEGWLLVLPQRQKGEVQLEFTTKKYGTMKKDLPLFTGTNKEGNIIMNPADTTAQYLVPGYKYTYTVRIGHTGMDISVSMEPWKELYVTQDIIF